MAYNITALLCTAMLIGKSWGCDKRPKCSGDKGKVDYRDVAELETKSRTWYQAEAFLKVHSGVFTIELLSNRSTPVWLDADELGVVELRKEFARIPSLEWLSLGENLIGEIRGFVFAGLPELRYLNLARNRIENISADSFHGLETLEILILKHNALKVLRGSINDDALPKLAQLHLQYNLLNADYEKDHGTKFELCHSNLNYLYLANNSISSFKPGHWGRRPCLKNLTHLYLENNRIFDFEVGDMPLEALSLNGNELAQIPEINPQLKFLSLAKNRITYLRNFTNDNKNILRFILSQNPIARSIVYAKFYAFSSLEHLALDNNCIKTIPDDVFNNLTSLRSLDLTGNAIAKIPAKAFARLSALEELHVGGNELSSFPGRALFARSNLKYLDFSYNKVRNVSKIQAKFIPGLKFLNVIGNPLGDTNPDEMSEDIEVLYEP